MNDFEKIEHLLLSKKFEELSPTEAKEVNGYFENATDYNDMRDTLMQVKSTLAADKLLIKPTVELKEKLLQQFDKTYTQSSGGGGLGKRRPFYKNIAFQWSAAASVVIIISVSIFGYIQNLNGKKSDGMAVNYEAKKDGAPSEESTLPTDQKPTGTITEKETDGKNRITTVNPEYIGDSRNEDETKKTKLYGNFYTTESEVGEGEIGISQNAPVKDNDDIITFSSTRDDNTTLGGYANTTVDPKKEEKKDDANYYFNDKVTTNAYRQNEDLKDQEKSLDLNTTIPLQNQGMTNTTVDYKKKANKREYWSKNKSKNKPKKDQDSKVGMENANVAQSTDSSKVKLDSLNIDSNKNLLEKNGDIQMEDNKKQD